MHHLRLIRHLESFQIFARPVLVVLYVLRHVCIHLFFHDEATIDFEDAQSLGKCVARCIGWHVVARSCPSRALCLLGCQFFMSPWLISLPLKTEQTERGIGSPSQHASSMQANFVNSFTIWTSKNHGNEEHIAVLPCHAIRRGTFLVCFQTCQALKKLQANVETIATSLLRSIPPNWNSRHPIVCRIIPAN